MSPCDIIERYLTVARGERGKKTTLEIIYAFPAIIWSDKLQPINEYNLILLLRLLYTCTN